MTKQEFLNRCENAWNMGLITKENLRLLDSTHEAMMRLEGGQTDIFVRTLNEEKTRTRNFDPSATLANDAIGYAVTRFMAILTHHCQQCAEDPQAWHTRGAFCPHKKDKT